jgi:hypothetical protein
MIALAAILSTPAALAQDPKAGSAPAAEVLTAEKERALQPR